MRPAWMSFGIVVFATGMLVSQACFGELLSVKEAIDLAHATNPDIRSLRNQLDSAEARARQSLAPSEPTLSINYNDLDKAFDVPNSASTSYTVTQPLAFPGKAFVNRNAMDHQAKNIYFQLRSKELDVANSVKTAYYQLALAKQNLVLNTETRESFQRILAVAKRRYEAGSITQVDLLSAEMDLYSNANDLADLENAEKTTRAQLNALLGRSLDGSIGVESIKMVDRPLLSEQQAEERMGQGRAEINAARELTDAASATYTLSKMSFLPDFQLTAGLNTYNFPPASPVISGNGLTQTYMIGIQMTVPIWGLLNEREGLVAASHDKAAADANLASVTLQSKTALEGALENLKALRKKIDNYEQHLITLSDQAFKLALVSYSSGKIDFQTLAGTATNRRQIRHDYYGLIVNYLTSYSAYGQLIGEDL